MRHVALLRGINVGGNNVIRMTDLKACLEEAGLEKVATYIASGNVLFDAPAKGGAKLAATIERALSKTFGYEASVVVLSRTDLRAAVRGAPKGFGADPKTYRYDVLFMRPPLTAAKAMKDVTLKEGVDAAHAGKRVIYFSRLDAKATQSRLSRFAGLPVYKSITARNWNTTTKILALLEAEGT